LNLKAIRAKRNFQLILRKKRVPPIHSDSAQKKTKISTKAQKSSRLISLLLKLQRTPSNNMVRPKTLIKSTKNKLRSVNIADEIIGSSKPLSPSRSMKHQMTG
jgi:hypothetical protein